MNSIYAFKTKHNWALGLAGLLGLLIGMPIEAAPLKHCKLLVLGDSLSAAYGIPTEQGWVALMEKRIAEKFPKCSVVNASISGETTAGGKTRLPDLLKKHSPSHMIVELGANDGLRGLSLDAMKSNLNQITSIAHDNKIETILVGMQIPPNYGPSYTQRFQSVYADVAKTHKVLLVPFLFKDFADNAQAFQKDGLHPNVASQKTILKTMWPAVSKILQP